MRTKSIVLAGLVVTSLTALTGRAQQPVSPDNAPVPEMPTVTLTCCLFAFWNSSATASVIGYTVLEPSTLTTCAYAGGTANAAATAKFLMRLANFLWKRSAPEITAGTVVAGYCRFMTAGIAGFGVALSPGKDTGVFATGHIHRNCG